MRFSKIMVVSILVALAMPALAQEVKYKTSDGKTAVGWIAETRAGWQDLGPSGTWWRNQNYITLLSLTPDQQKRMDDVFQQSRIKLIDLKANLDKEEAILEPLMKADRLDETRVAPQIDKVADARAELEKANARMLLGIRQVLTPEQWTKLSSSKGFYAGALEGYYKLATPKK
jgi:Spy/CpxP family protein refolding chaperone